MKVGNQDFKGVAQTFAIKDPLKAAGSQWQTTGWKGWAKSFPAKDFDIEVIKREIWAGAADGIDVSVFDDHDALAVRYLVDSGQWFRQT